MYSKNSKCNQMQMCRELSVCFHSRLVHRITVHNTTSQHSHTHIEHVGRAPVITLWSPMQTLGPMLSQTIGLSSLSGCRDTKSKFSCDVNMINSVFYLSHEGSAPHYDAVAQFKHTGRRVSSSSVCFYTVQSLQAYVMFYDTFTDEQFMYQLHQTQLAALWCTFQNKSHFRQCSSEAQICHPGPRVHHISHYFLYTDLTIQFATYYEQGFKTVT